MNNIDTGGVDTGSRVDPDPRIDPGPRIENGTVVGASVRRRTLTTADLADSANRSERPIEGAGEFPEDAESYAAASTERRTELAPLFDDGIAKDFRDRWAVVQQGFVDDPKRSVRQGDELVAQVIKSLAETFSQQRSALEGEQGSTEDLRLALRRYRSFFERLLSI